MTYSYYPGCTLRTKAKDLDRYARLSAQALGIELCELPDWQCCGGVYPMAKDEIATKLSSVRALTAARDAGTDLVTMCAACHNVLKQVNHELRTDADVAAKAANYLKPDVPYAGETNVIHFLELLRDVVGFDELKKKVVKPLKDVKIAPYYGCLLLRPGRVMAFDDPENPSVMEDFIAALGAAPVRYAMRNECCGGYATLEKKEIAVKRANAVLENAAANGAQTVITACPLCLYNLSKNAASPKLPVKYFTEVLAEALGVKEDA